MLEVNLFIFGLYLKLSQKSLIKEGNNLNIAKVLHKEEMEEVTCKQVEVIRVSLEESSTHMVQRTRENRLKVNIVAETTLKRECLARGKTCIICNKKGHFTNVCSSNKQENKKQRSNKAIVAQKQEYPHSNTK